MKIEAFAIIAMLVPAARGVSVTGTAGVNSPTAASSLSGTSSIAQALSLSAAEILSQATLVSGSAAVSQAISLSAEEEIQDDAELVTDTAKLDLSQADTLLLTKISENIGLTQDKVLFNIEERAPADKPGAGVDEVEVKALYQELARRAKGDEKEARQSLGLAILRGDTRARDAKDMAALSSTAKSSDTPVALSPSAMPTAAAAKVPGI